ncbi:DUF2878 domain-containing protein [Leucothrix arctica]|nr:DUF2878 domain-containing protein [Leucothrix arctica]
MPPFSIANIFVFQAAWFSAALLRDQAFWIMVPLLALHFYFTTSRRADLKLVLFLLPLGLLVEMGLILSELVWYESALTLPVWMVLLWVHLIISFNHSLRWLEKVPWIAVAVLGGISGATSYVAGSNFGAMYMAPPEINTLGILAVLWALLILLMSRVAKYNNKRVV